MVALRYKPARPLIPAFLLMFFVSAQIAALIPPLPIVALMAVAAIAFASISIGNALWDTMLQQHIPEHTISRVSALDWTISLVSMPLGYVAGPLAEAIGIDLNIGSAAGASLAANIGLLLVPSVRNLRRVEQPPPVEDEEPEPIVAPVPAVPV